MGNNLFNPCQVIDSRMLSKLFTLCRTENWKMIKLLQSVGGWEEVSYAFSAFIRKKRITASQKFVQTLQQNRVAERTNRTFLNMGWLMLRLHTVVKEAHADAIDTAVYVLNRLACSGIFLETYILEVLTSREIEHSVFSCFLHQNADIMYKKRYLEKLLTNVECRFY